MESLWKQLRSRCRSHSIVDIISRPILKMPNCHPLGRDLKRLVGADRWAKTFVSGKVMRILFVCTQNRLRSPTAEAVFSEYSGLEVLSAGLGSDAANPVTPELVSWAEVIFLMEKSHRNKLQKKFKPQLKSQRLVVLGIPDEYNYMDPRLIVILKEKVSRHLRLEVFKDS